MENLGGIAVAKLVMVSGNLVSDAEVSEVFGMFQYREDPLTPYRFDSETEDGSALEISANLESIDVFGCSKDHLNNINYILQKLGWIDCQLYSKSRDIEHLLLGRLVNINITENLLIGESSALDDTSKSSLIDHDPAIESYVDLPAGGDAPLDSRELTDPADEAVQALNDEYEKIQNLTIQLADAEQENCRISDLYQAAMRRVHDLENKGNDRVAPPLSGAGEVGLISFVEKHLNSIIDISDKIDSSMVEDLRNSGYQVQVKLVRLS